MGDAQKTAREREDLDETVESDNAAVYPMHAADFMLEHFVCIVDDDGVCDPGFGDYGKPKQRNSISGQRRGTAAFDFSLSQQHDG